ncbi:MAG TPA: hypothetical protein VF166_08605 [Gemmatimonadaceae bacterium]
MTDARMIYIGIDDTDTLDTRGTNQLARRLAASLPAGFEFVLALRHQLLFDPRIPYTSKNGCASLLVRSERDRRASELLPILRREMRSWYVPGSDPGLCVAELVPEEIIAFGKRCQQEPVRQTEARALAAEHDVYLEGFGGTEGGVIGALAGVGLLAHGDDGRVVHMSGWEWPDPFCGWQPIERVRERGVDEVREKSSNVVITSGMIDIGKHLRPSYRGGRVVLFVEDATQTAVPSDPEAERPRTQRWRAMKLP